MCGEHCHASIIMLTLLLLLLRTLRPFSVLGIGQNKSRNLKEDSDMGEDGHNPQVREVRDWIGFPTSDNHQMQCAMQS